MQLLRSFIPASFCHHTMLALPGVSLKVIYNIYQESKTLWISSADTWQTSHADQERKGRLDKIT